MFFNRFDDDGDFAELKQVTRPQRPLAVAETHPVEARAVGAAEIADAPAAVGDAQFGVVAANGTIV